jgi:hypothetical protein
MRRTFAVAAGIGAVAAVSMALLVPTGAGAAQTTTTVAAGPTIIGNMCDKLPGLKATATGSLGVATANLTTVNEALVGRRAAMTMAMTQLATAVVKHLGALDVHGATDVTGAALKSAQAKYVDSVVAWSKARSQAYDGEQAFVFGQLQNTLLDTLTTTACP